MDRNDSLAEYEGTMTMERDNGEESVEPLRSGRVKIEWNWDLDDEWLRINSIGSGGQKETLGEEGRFRLKGRCKRCWGGLIAKKGEEQEPIAIRCRVCGLLLERDEAREEYRRMSKESGLKTAGMALGIQPKDRDDATLVHKIFPHMERQTEEELRQRSRTEAQKGIEKGWLTRISFPAGSAGLLFLQARALMSGVERLPRGLSGARFSDVDMHDDGSANLSSRRRTERAFQD